MACFVDRVELNHTKLFIDVRQHSSRLPAGAVALAVLVDALTLASCGAGAPPRRQVRVAAAADLNAALGDLVARFSASHSVDVGVSYGSSGNFVAQLISGAPFDLFLSADVSYPRQLAARGLVVEGSEFVYAIGRLVAWVPRSSTIDLRGTQPVRALADQSVARISVANPEHAPYGRAAVAALKSAGIYDAVKPRLVFGENVAQALQFAQTGAADAALVAKSLVVAPSQVGTGRFVEVPADTYPALEQGGAILKAAADLEAARALRAYILGTEGRTILRQYGFALPER
jgi:molybdate transport system substrate-binding protein